MRVIPRLLSLIVSLCAATQVLVMGSESVVLLRSNVRGASVCVVIADLNDPGVKVDICLPVKGIRHSEAFTNLVRRHGPLAAVTGTYFDMRTLIPTGSIVIDGKIVHQNYIGTAVCFTIDNKVTFVSVKPGEACDLSNAECGIRTGPRLLANSRYALNPRREGFRHPGLFGARTRMALGVTSCNKLLLVCVRTPVTFATLASIMKSLGAVDAACLDGGTSSAMYFKGRVVQRPGRMLTNIIEIRDRLNMASLPKQARRRGYISIQWVAASQAELDGGRIPDHVLGAAYDQVAIILQPIKLRLAKGVHSLFPINRA